MTEFELNGAPITVHSSDDTPLLWVLRDEMKLPGTKFGCGAGLCGACTVLLGGEAVRSCVLPVAAVAGKSVVTIEGLGGQHPVQQAWIEASVPQCGFCQSGQILTAVALLAAHPDPAEGDIKRALRGNICRCGAYQQILSAVRLAAGARVAAVTVDAEAVGAGRAPLPITHEEGH